MTTASKRPDLEALRKETAEVLTDPQERAQALRDLDALEKMIGESERKAAALHAGVMLPYQPASRTRLAVILVLCTLIVVVVAGFWLPQVLDSGVVSTSRYNPVTADSAPIEYWLTIGAAAVTAAVCAFSAVFAFFALMRYPNHPFRQRAAASADLASTHVDPLAEAEVYVTFGRAEQAIEVLREGLAREPLRTDLADRLRQLRQR